MLPLIAYGFLTFDGLQGTMGGILRGCGKQKYGAIVNVTAFYAVGIPICFVATLYLKWELFGTWLGLALAELGVATPSSNLIGAYFYTLLLILVTEIAKSVTLYLSLSRPLLAQESFRVYAALYLLGIPVLAVLFYTGQIYLLNLEKGVSIKID